MGTTYELIVTQNNVNTILCLGKLRQWDGEEAEEFSYWIWDATTLKPYEGQAYSVILTTDSLRKCCSEAQDPTVKSNLLAIIAWIESKGADWAHLVNDIGMDELFGDVMFGVDADYETHESWRKWPAEEFVGADPRNNFIL